MSPAIILDDDTGNYVLDWHGEEPHVVPMPPDVLQYLVDLMNKPRVRRVYCERPWRAS